jgi:hypothetical protein
METQYAAGIKLPDFFCRCFVVLSLNSFILLGGLLEW